MQDPFAWMRRHFTFQGRARRREYWTFQLMYAGLLLGGLLLDALLKLPPAWPIALDNVHPVPPVTLTLYLLLALPNAAVTARRLHDTGYSGRLQLLSAIPTFFLALGVLTLQDTQAGANAWGENPKAARHRARRDRRTWWTTYLGNIP